MATVNEYVKHLVEQYKYPIVIVNLDHTIIYVNQAAKVKYSKRGITNLVNSSVFKCHNQNSNDKILSNVEKMENGESEIFLTISKENQKVFMVAIRDENNTLIGYYERFEDIHPATSCA